MKNLKKLELKKEVIARISNDELHQLRGGQVTVTDNICPTQASCLSIHVKFTCLEPINTPTPAPQSPTQASGCCEVPVTMECPHTSHLFNSCEGYTC